MSNLLKNKKIESILTHLLFFILTYFTFGYWLNTVDDLIYSQLCQNHYLTVNSFQWVSHANYFLNKIFPNINGWSLFMICSIFISSYKLYYLFLRKVESK